MSRDRAPTGKHYSPSGVTCGFSRQLLGRLCLLAIVLAADVFLLAITPHAFSLLGPFAQFGIASFAVYLSLGFPELKRERQRLPFGLGFFLAHLGCILAISLTDIATLHGSGFPAESWKAHLLLRGLLLVGILSLALACIPLAIWIDILRRTQPLLAYAAIAGAFAWCLHFPMQSLWDPSSSGPGRLLQVLTFHSVKAVLSFFLPNIYVDPDAFVIGTQRFSIYIAEACSGFEGLGLVFAFTTVWLWYFRKESRFPQSLLLIPCALVLIWTLNVVRVSVLVLIGNAGYGEIAMVGFHSQAGWIAFTCVGIAFSMTTRKLAWVKKDTGDFRSPLGSIIPGRFAPYAVPSATGSAVVNPSLIESENSQSGESPAVRAYLVPFLAILAASFLSKAMSGHFEWLYPLRFLAAAIAIWHYGPELRKTINWRVSWFAPVTGMLICVAWLIPSWWAHGTSGSQLGEALAALPPAARWSWIAFRVAAAVITVPIAEELAFRGYLARRLVKREFDSVSPTAITMLSIGLSSAAFGLMHGQRWIVGTLAGLAYAGILKRSGRLSDAIVAHGTSDLLLAIWVLGRGDWSLW